VPRTEHHSPHGAERVHLQSEALVDIDDETDFQLGAAHRQ